MADVVSLPSPTLLEGWRPSYFAGEWVRAVGWDRPCRPGEVPYMALLEVHESETAFNAMVTDGATRIVSGVGSFPSLLLACEAAEALWCGCRVRR